MSYLEGLSFQVKTFFLVIVLVSFTVIAVARYHLLVNELTEMSIEQTTGMMLTGYKNELKDIVDVMAVTLSSSTQGIQDEEQTYTMFAKLIKQARFFPDKSGYYFIYKKGGTGFAHAAQPDLEKKNLINMKDPKGKMLIKELDEVSQAGGGFVEYWWEKPKRGLQPKLSYARMIPGGQYWIGAGVYIDDIQEKKETILTTIQTRTNSFLKELYIMLGSALVLFAIPLTWFLIVSIVKPIRELTIVAEQFSRGSLDLDIPHIGRGDEIGKMAEALERLGMSIKVAIARLKQ